MADSETEISKEELQKEIAEILQNASLDKTSTKKVIQKLEKKFGVDLSAKKKLIDQLVMDYVNSMDSDEDSEKEEPQVVAPPKKVKKETDDDDEERDDSNDSDWGYQQDENILLDGSSDEHYRSLHQEPPILTSQRQRPIPKRTRKAVILKRVSQQTREEDECDIFGKLTAKKLRRFPEDHRDALMIQVNQLFYDKSHGRSTTLTLSPNRQEPITITTSNVTAARHLTPTQIQAKKIYRVNSIPKLVSSSASGTGSLVTVASPSNNVHGQKNTTFSVKLTPTTNKLPEMDAHDRLARENTTANGNASASVNERYSCQIM